MKPQRATCIPFAFALAVVFAVAARAHDGRPIEPHDLISSWSLEPGVVAGLALTAWLYIRGRRRMKRGRRIESDRRWPMRACAFAGGWLALFVALVSPLDALGSSLFAAHMTQHELLMVVAAPLIVLGRPMAPLLVALPAALRGEFSRARRSVFGRSARRLLFSPLAAWMLHAAVLWIWHVPVLFEATLESGLVHTLQHMSFLLSALIFCEALIHGDEGRMGYGAAVIYLFTTAVHTSVLGALLTFSATVWYPVYETTARAWGLSPLEDQQVGGLVMWVPAGIVYTIGGVLMLGLWMREAERRVMRREAMMGAAGRE